MSSRPYLRRWPLKEHRRLAGPTRCSAFGRMRLASSSVPRAEPSFVAPRPPRPTRDRPPTTGLPTSSPEVGITANAMVAACLAVTSDRALEGIRRIDHTHSAGPLDEGMDGRQHCLVRAPRGARGIRSCHHSVVTSVFIHRAPIFREFYHVARTCLDVGICHRLG